MTPPQAPNDDAALLALLAYPDDAWIAEMVERWRDVPAGTPIRIIRYRRLSTPGESDEPPA